MSKVIKGRAILHKVRCIALHKKGLSKKKSCGAAQPVIVDAKAPGSFKDRSGLLQGCKMARAPWGTNDPLQRDSLIRG